MPGNASTPNVTLIEHPQPTSGVKRSWLGAVDVVFPSRAQFRSVYDASQADLGPTARMFEHGRETRRPRPGQRERTEPLFEDGRETRRPRPSTATANAAGAGPVDRPAEWV